MNTRKRSLVLFFGILLAVVGMCIGGSLASAASPPGLDSMDRIAVSASPAASAPSETLTGKDVRDISETLKSPAAWWATKEEPVSAGSRQLRAEVFLVGGPFADFHPKKMLHGNFLSRLGGDERSIVLDRDLAWQLFGTEDAVGMEAETADGSYTVTGVCDTDTSLLGLLSGTGTPAAYIAYGDSDAPVAGMEVSLPKSLPGKSLADTKAAFGSQGKSASGFLFSDVSETARLDAETAMLPEVLLACILTGIAVLWAKDIITGMIRSLRLYMEDRYLAECWRAVLWRIAKMALVCAGAAGAVWGFWLLADFPFYLPGRFVPASWIDMDFYKTLLQAQAQERIAAYGFPAQPWQMARDAGMQIAGYMNMTAFAGLAVFAAGLALVRDAREERMSEKGLKPHWDLFMIWVFLTGSLGVAFAVCSAMGLTLRLPWELAALMGFGLTVWALRALYKEEITGFFAGQ